MTEAQPLTVDERLALISTADDYLYSDLYSASDQIESSRRSFGMMADAHLKRAIALLIEYTPEPFIGSTEVDFIRDCIEHIDWDENRDYLNARTLFIAIEVAPVARFFSDHVDASLSIAYKTVRVAANLALRVTDPEALIECARGYLLESLVLGPADPNTPFQRWLGEHALNLAAHADLLMERRSLDYDLCESLLTTAPALVEGTL